MTLEQPSLFTSMLQKLPDDTAFRWGDMKKKVETHYQSIARKAQVLRHPALGLNLGPIIYTV